jgi:Zn-dependent protease with chaperone function
MSGTVPSIVGYRVARRTDETATGSLRAPTAVIATMRRARVRFVMAFVGVLSVLFYAADGQTAAVTGDSLALARTLRAVDEATYEELRLQGLFADGTAQPEPLHRLPSTHPGIADLIAQLEALAAG